MPPNVTSLIQPMDQNVIRLTKLFYRTSLLSTLIANNNKTVNAFLKGLTMRDAVVYLAQAWEKVTSTVIEKCWREIFISTGVEFYEDDDIPLSRHLQVSNPEMCI